MYEFEDLILKNYSLLAETHANTLDGILPTLLEPCPSSFRLHSAWQRIFMKAHANTLDEILPTLLEECLSSLGLDSAWQRILTEGNISGHRHGHRDRNISTGWCPVSDSIGTLKMSFPRFKSKSEYPKSWLGRSQVTHSQSLRLPTHTVCLILLILLTLQPLSCRSKVLFSKLQWSGSYRRIRHL